MRRDRPMVARQLAHRSRRVGPSARGSGAQGWLQLCVVIVRGGRPGFPGRAGAVRRSSIPEELTEIPASRGRAGRREPRANWPCLMRDTRGWLIALRSALGYQDGHGHRGDLAAWPAHRKGDAGRLGDEDSAGIAGIAGVPLAAGGQFDLPSRRTDGLAA